MSLANLIWPEVSDATHIHNDIPGHSMEGPLLAALHRSAKSGMIIATAFLQHCSGVLFK